MSLYYYDPFYEPFFPASELGRLFDAAFDARAPSTSREVTRSDDSSSSVPGVMRPRMDLHGSKDKNEMTATFELPGMKKDDVEIDVHNNRLIVSGQSTTSNELDNEGYALRERRYGRFSRALPLPPGTKPEEIKANMDNGVLTVKFPKTKPEQEAKKITIG